MCSLSDLFNTAEQQKKEKRTEVRVNSSASSLLDELRALRMETNGAALRRTARSGWNCLHSGSACCDNSAPIILLYSISCQIDRRRPCSALLAC